MYPDYPAMTSFPDDFPLRLERFKEASGMSWRTLARRMGVEPRDLRRWRSGTRPSAQHLFALLHVASSLSLCRLLFECGPVGNDRAPAGWKAQAQCSPAHQ